MSMRPRSGIVGVSALAFVVVLGGLTALRAWYLEPPTHVQSLVVDAGAVVVVAGVASHVARGERVGTRIGEGIVLPSARVSGSQSTCSSRFRRWSRRCGSRIRSSPARCSRSPSVGSVRPSATPFES